MELSFMRLFFNNSVPKICTFPSEKVFNPIWVFNTHKVLLEILSTLFIPSDPFFPLLCHCWKTMDKRRRRPEKTSSCYSEEVSSIEWEFIRMSEQEEDLIHRMYKLVGDRWGLIAGRIPGRKAEEIERFWIMRHGEVFASRREKLSRSKI